RRTSHRARVAAIVSAAASQRDPVDAALLLATLAGEPEPSGALQAALSIAAAPIPTVVTGTGEPLAGALFADGGRVVVAVPSSATGLPSVWRLDVSTGARGAGVSLGSPGVPAQLLAVSHDGRRVLFIGPDSGAGPTARETLYVRDALTGRVVARILDGPCSSPLNRLSAGFTRGGDVWSACADGELGLWRVGSTATVLPTRALGDSIAAVDVSPDGRLVAIGRRDGRIEISHVASDTALVVQDGRRAPSAIRFTADGSQVVVLQPDSMIVRYSTTAYELRPPLWSLPARILDFALSPDGRAVVAMEWGNVAHVLVDSIEAPALPHADRLLAVDFTADGRSVVTMAEGGRARVWPVVGPRAARLLPGEQGAWTVAFSADGRRVFSAGSFVAMVQNADGSGEPLVIRNPGPERVAGVLNAFAGVGFTADGRVLTLARDDAIRQWSAERVGVPPLVMSVASPAVDPDDRIIVAAAFSGDGRTVATLSHGNGPLRVRSVDGFGDTLSVPHGRRTRVVALSHDGRTLLLDDTDSAGRPVLRLRRPDGRWRTLALSDPPTRVAFGADAATVLATVGPGAIVWHPDSARATVLSDDAQGMVAVESSMDGQSLVTVSRDGTVRLRRVGGSALVLSPPDGASAAAFSSDGSRIATAGDAGVHVWPLRWPELVAELARSTTACLAEDKRRIYLAESVDDAHAAWLACERAHGRGREPAVRPP
ncbi:MAG: WD40 repeat domain-containing protein, partial [Gemmatirosa sp.]|nr:WD40 repeat domain-containing protein [Gemmatirosa sp.]